MTKTQNAADPFVLAWTTENSEAVVWGTHDLAIAKEAYDVMGFDSAPDWSPMEKRWGAPALVDKEVWGPDETSTTPVDGWVPFLVFGFWG